MSAPPESDALQYHSIAVNLISGHGYVIVPDVVTTYRPPAYPIFLALIYTMFGVDYKYALYFQSFLNSLLVLPLFCVARRLTESAACGLLAAGLFAVHTSFEIVGRLYAENLLIPLALTFAMAMYQMVRCSKRRLWYAVVVGIVAGLMGLTKPEYTMVGVAALLCGLILPVFRQYWKYVLVATGVSFLLLGGWAARNALTNDPVEKNIAKNTLIRAYYPAFNGSWWWAVMDMDALERQRDDSRRFFKNQGENAHLNAQLFKLAQDHPVGILKLVLSRVLILWCSPPVGSSTIKKISPRLEGLVLGGQLFFIISALIAMIRLIAERPELFGWLVLALYMTVVYGLLHAIRRYGYPFVPGICLFEACAFKMGWEWWRRKYRNV